MLRRSGSSGMFEIGLIAGTEAESLRREIAPRLRDATISCCVDFNGCDKLPEACSAVVVLGRIAVDFAAIENLLRGGRSVLLAFEPCCSWDVLQRLMDTAGRAGVQFSVVNADRYLPSRLVIRNQIPKKLGEIGLVRIHRWQSRGCGSATACGDLPGPLVADLDLAVWLAGKLPNRVFSLQRRATDAREQTSAAMGRFLQVHLGFPEGMALIDFDNQLPEGGDYCSLSVIGSTGAAYADDHQNRQLLFRRGPPQAVCTGEGTKYFAEIVQEFVAALAANRDVSATVTTWRTVFTIADAVNESLESGQAVSFEGGK